MIPFAFRLYHLHYAEEEMFVILEGQRTTRYDGAKHPVCEVAVYPDSGKIGAYGRNDERFAFIARSEDGVDYFDGEELS